MNEAHSAIDSAISEAELLRRALKKKASTRVRSTEERSIIKANSLAWFKNHRPQIEIAFGQGVLSDIDDLFREILSSSERETSRASYLLKLGDIRQQLIDLRSLNILNLTSPAVTEHTSDAPPNFASLISDLQMRQILQRRWNECNVCIAAKAPLAATVMMGGLLEALLLARVNRETNKQLIFKATSAPKDKATSKTLPLKEWTLRNYIDVAHELGWISQSAKDVGEVLRDYRNYIHPYKELSHGVTLGADDAVVLWEVSKSISRQIL